MIFNQQPPSHGGGSTETYTVTAPDEGIAVPIFEGGEYQGTLDVDTAEFPTGVMVWYKNYSSLSSVDLASEEYPDGGFVEVFDLSLSNYSFGCIFPMPPTNCWIIGE